MTPTLQQLMAHELIMLCPIHEEENDPNSQSTALELTILWPQLTWWRGWSPFSSSWSQRLQMLWPKVTCWREWPPDSDSLGVSLIVNRTYITKRMPQTLYKWMALELATFWLNSHDEEDDPQTPAVDGLGVGPASCSHQNFRGQVSRRAAKCLHHGARVHKLGQAKVCHLQPTQMKQNPSEVNIMDNPRSFSCN